MDSGMFAAETLKTVEELKNRTGDFSVIARSTKIHPSTLSKLVHGRLTNPTVRVIGALHHYFSKEASSEQSEAEIESKNQPPNNDKRTKKADERTKPAKTATTQAQTGENHAAQ
jgi:hypothetical protein